MSAITAAARQVPDSMIKDLVESTREVFDTMVFQEAVARPARADAADRKAEVVATIALMGPSDGVIALYGSTAVAKSIAGSMLGLAAEEITNEFPDAIGELANMIAGTFRNRMMASGGSWGISVPTVTIGMGIITHYPTDVGRVVCPFDMQAGELSVELVLRT